MKLLVPVQSDKGAESRVYAHFGRAPGYMVIDIDKADKKIDNFKLTFVKREEGLNGADNVVQIRPDAVVTFSIGEGAFARLKEIGIRIYKASVFTVKEIANAFIEGTLKELEGPEKEGEYMHAAHHEHSLHHRDFEHHEAHGAH